MARKSIKGYAEKNYYDNTRFTGGIVATNDPLNEGSFKHLVNLDITDTGQSVTPRKGFLTTSVKGQLDIHRNITVTRYYTDVFRYEDTTPQTVCIFYDNSTEDYKSGWFSRGGNVPNNVRSATYIIILDSNGRIAYANFTNTDYRQYNCNDYYSNDFTKHPLFSYRSTDCYDIVLRPGYTVIGFTNIYSDAPTKTLLALLKEQNYNSIITYKYSTSGGIDFTVVGRVLMPIPLSSDTIYFYDESLGEYIFVSFSNSDVTSYRVTFDISGNFIESSKVILNFDLSDIENIIPDDCYIVPSSGNQAIRALDEYHTTGYIIKVDLKNTDNVTVKSLWLRLFYRENASEFEGKSYEADTLVISYLNTSDVVNYVDTAQRNLASSESIIPNPMQEIYEIEEAPIGHYDRFPMIYMKQNGKYLINETNKLDNIEIIPNFYLENVDNSKYRWAYTYDIISTFRLLTNDSEEIYHAPIIDLVDNSATTINGTSYYMYSIQLNSAITYATDSIKRNYIPNLSIRIDDRSDIQARLEPEQYHVLLDKLAPENVDETAYVLYIVPIPDANKSVLDIDLTSSKYLGRLGLHTYFGNCLIKNVNTGADIPEAVAHNEYIKNYGIFHDAFCTYKNFSIIKYNSTDILETLLSYLDSQGFGVYITNYTNYKYRESNAGYQNIKSTKLDSVIYTWESAPLTAAQIRNDYELYNKLLRTVNITLVYMDHTTVVNVKGSKGILVDYNANGWFSYCKNYTDLFYNMPEDTGNKTYYITMRLGANKTYNASNIDTYEVADIYYVYARYRNAPNSKNTVVNSYNNIFFAEKSNSSDSQNRQCSPTSNALVDIGDRGTYTTLLPNYQNDTLFSYVNVDNVSTLLGKFDIYQNSLLYNLYEKNYFDTGLHINFYLVQLPVLDEGEHYPSRELLIESSPFKLSRQLIKTQQPITTYIEKLEEDPRTIAKANNSIIFESPLGDHLVLWVNNKVYISKENMQYYFTEEYKHEFSESVVKVIAYKDMLLVFSTQHLYAIYLYEDTINVENGTNEDGTTKYVQQKVYQFAKLPVLYNLLVSEKYKEVIQVYNQMVLFYSADGQLFLIKPTAAIDSNTRFSIQYFNKSANDILLNYKDYMQDRLYSYGLSDIIKDEDIIIKATANINYIKIFYCVPGLMTYILIYDVINNRYTVYDTLSFTKINSLQYIPTGELYITEHDDQLYFTVDNNNMNDVDTNTDIAYYNNFSPFPINAEIDTGTINLNNHLKKRFKDLHVIYKNLNANTLEFSLDTYVDDVPIMTHIESNLEIRNVSGYNTLVTLDTNKVTQLVNKLEEMLLKDELLKNNALFNFTDYTSNKIITHKTNIVSKGKTIRVKMNFISKGRYKIQGYGLIYKEHTV